MWLAGGLALVVAELATPSGFFIIFFGLGALTVGVLAALERRHGGAGCSGCCSPCCRSAYLLLFRGRLAGQASRCRRRRTSIRWSASWPSCRSGCCRAWSAASKCAARSWSARNTSSVTLDAGQRARVAAVDGLTLAVVPE